MADLVLAIGCSHSPLLASPPEDYAKHAELDAGGRPLLDRAGNRVTYGELLAEAPPSLQDEICLEVLEAKHQRCNAAIDRIAAALKDADLDVLIVIGDDQHEQYFDDNMPSILVYWGETIANRELQLPEDAPDFWRRARSQFHEADGVQEYPVSSTLGLHLIEHLIATDFDVSHGTSLRKARGEGHAFGFVHKRLMRTRIVPIVPIALNTYFPPNQPRPARCYQLGQQIRAAVAAWPGDKRVGIIASGGLTHFTIDEEFDRAFLDACKSNDQSYFNKIDTKRLQSGSSEMRNWIVAAAAAANLETSWQDYIPCYRSAAGTGCGMGFAVWSKHQ